MPKPLTLPVKLDRFPPVVVRLLARQQTGLKVAALTDAQVAQRSGLSLGEVKMLSKLTSWESVEVGTMMAFCKGCGADLSNRDWLKLNTQYMNEARSIPLFLRKSPEWKKTFEPLIAIWFRHEQEKAA